VRRLAAAFALLLLSFMPAFAAGQVFDTPKALLDYAYKPYSTGNFVDDNGILYSKALNAMFAAAEAATPEDEVGPVDFDVFVNGQDYQLTDLAIGESSPEGDGVTIPVSLKNFGEPQSLVFHFVKEDGGWKISDIESLTPNDAWRLTTLLTPDPAQGTDAAPAAGSSN
jgi:hypothetical protein